MDRRIFLRRVAVTSSLAAGSLAIGFGLKSDGIQLEDDSSEAGESSNEIRQELPDSGKKILAVVKGEDPFAITEQAVGALGGMKRFVSKGDKVLVKPNIGWDRRPKFAANTNPDVVAAVVKMCLESGASKVIVTDSSCNNPDRCLDKSGLKKSLVDMDVDLFMPTERDYVEKDLGGEVLKTWPVLKAVLECDKIINIPIAKHHSSAILSLGMKNWYGILGGGKRRGQLHQEMARSIAELAGFVRPVLTVMDAFRILLRNGPQGGSLNDTEVKKTVIASADPVAVDAYGAGLFNLNPEDVPYIPIAHAAGLGTKELDSIETVTIGG